MTRSKRPDYCSLILTCSILSRCAESGDCCCDFQDICLQTPAESPVLLPDVPAVPQCRAGGSCGGRCGGGSDLDCWCDDLCQQHGDCCCDRDSLCSEEFLLSPPEDFLLSPPELSCFSGGSCAGRCDGGSDEDCWCDDQCQHLGDCCCDRQQFCSAQVNITSTFTTTIITTSLADITTTPAVRLITTDLESQQDTTTIAGPTSTVETREETTPLAVTRAGTDCWCSTNTLGPVKEACCVFPFSYKSEVHHSCVEVEAGERWCSTNTTADGQFVPDQWGFCGETCYFDTPTPLTTPLTTSGNVEG